MAEKSLTELAAEVQAIWTDAYIEAHHLRRTLVRLAVLILALALTFFTFYVSEDKEVTWWTRASLSIVLPLGTFAAAMLAAKTAELTSYALKEWTMTWGISILQGCVWTSHLTMDHRYLVAALYAAVVLAIPTVSYYGLRIPRAPFIPWEDVENDILSNVTTAVGGNSYPRIIHNYEDAEEVSASWLRRLGYTDAKVTKRGKDNGIDIYAARAIGQVKWWRKKNVGIVDVQRLVGAAKPGQFCYFFAAKGYTREALKWAEDSDRRIALFLLRPDGNLEAVSYEAKKALWTAPPHMPKRNRKPVSAKEKLALLAFPSIMMTLLLVAFVWGFLTTPPMRNLAAILFFGGLISLYLLLILMILDSSCSRMLAYFRLPKEQRKWPGWEAILTEPVDLQDAGLASDRFIEYVHSPPFIKVFDLYRSIARNIRTMRRIVRNR